MLLPLTAALLMASPSMAQGVTRRGDAAAAISSVVVVSQPHSMAYVSGLTAPASGPGAAVAGDTEAQTVAILGRMDDLLKAQGMGLGDVVMMRVYLVSDPAQPGSKMDFRGMMAGYRQFFGTAAQPNKPSRTTVQVVGLASPGALVEIEAQAVRGR
jgi:enamine deaminase RidA (YjgF/YER057c/UK114 family)